MANCFDCGLALHPDHAPRIASGQAFHPTPSHCVSALLAENETLRKGAANAIDAFRFLPNAGLNMDTRRRMNELARAVSIAWCTWHPGGWEPSHLPCPRCQDETAAAIAAQKP